MSEYQDFSEFAEPKEASQSEVIDISHAEVTQGLDLQLPFKTVNGIPSATVLSSGFEYKIVARFTAQPGVSYRVRLEKQTRKGQKSIRFGGSFNCIPQTQTSKSDDERLAKLLAEQKQRLSGKNEK